MKKWCDDTVTEVITATQKEKINGGRRKWMICRGLTPLLRGLQGRGDFIFTELPHGQCGEGLVGSVNTGRSVLVHSLFLELDVDEVYAKRKS